MIRGGWRALAPVLVAIAQVAQAAPAPASDARGPRQFSQWASSHTAALAAFQAYLQGEGVASVVPTWQLLRTASDWNRCNAEPFALAPRAQWPAVARTLQLLRELRARQALGDFEVVSAWRSQALNNCAHGAPRSAHVRSFAVDLQPGAATPRLCEFWKQHGQAWNMGLSRYPSGRVHLDTAGYRTWGADHGRHSSFCQ